MDYYEKNFDTQEHEIAGEITPSYFSRGKIWGNADYTSYRWSPNDDPASRIHDSYPDIKLIFSLRNPITRAYSQYRKNYRQGREDASSFGEAIREELDGERKPGKTPFCWVYNNRYSVHLDRWLELFNEDQLKILIFEKWIDETEDAMNEVCEFLGVGKKQSWSRTQEKMNVGGTPRFVFLNRFYQKYLQGTPIADVLRKSKITHALDSLNSKEGYPDMSEEEKILASDVFEDEIEYVEKLTGESLEPWRGSVEP
jgi:hypothetical protein